MRVALAAYAVLMMAVMKPAQPAWAAELFYLDHDQFTDHYIGPTGPLVVSGEIAVGDYQRLLAKILEDEPRFLTQNKIILASDGGDVREALKIANLVKSLYSEIIVGPLTGRCVSACFFIYAAAAERQTEGEHLLGVNRPFIDAGENSEVTPTDAATPNNAAEAGALGRVRAFLQDNEVPAYLIDEMFRRGSDELYWLTSADATKLGVKSTSFMRLLAARCGWSAEIEQEALAGKRPVDEVRRILECRGRITRAAAHEVLIKAAKTERSPAH